MSKHVEQAMEIRNQVPLACNCAQTMMKVYAEELGLTQEQAMQIAANFGGGMKCGSVCGAVTAGLMILGMKGIASPAQVGAFRKGIADQHDGMLNCVDLLRANAQKGGDKKTHCDGMICQAIERIDSMTEA